MADDRLGEYFRRTSGTAPIAAVELLRPAQRTRWLAWRILHSVRERLLPIEPHFELINTFRENGHPGPADTDLEALRAEVRQRLGDKPDRRRFCVLLTGATGFIGMECVQAFARNDQIAQVYCLLRPGVLRQRGSGQITRRLSARERGETLLADLQLTPEERLKFEFIEGDVAAPLMGIGALVRVLAPKVTHVVHLAASVSFDEPYEQARRSNLEAVEHSLALSAALRDVPGSPFVSHVAIETAYVHGRTRGGVGSESTLRFPRGFYNNYYELTKAMGSMAARRFMLERRLPVIQLLPAIVVGRSACGSNHGDRKVLNGPINALAALGGVGPDRAGAHRRVAPYLVFPADPEASLNLVAVDRVAQAIERALGSPEAVGRRIHLGAPEPLSMAKMEKIFREEFDLHGRIMSPLLFLMVAMPAFELVRRLTHGRTKRLFASLIENVTSFQTYCEGRQPRHEVGHDQKILGLGPPAPAEELARMQCRHNRYVVLTSKSRQLGEIEQRAAQWRRALGRIEAQTGRRAAQLSAREFHAALAANIDLGNFAPWVEDGSLAVRAA